MGLNASKSKKGYGSFPLHAVKLIKSPNIINGLRSDLNIEDITKEEIEKIFSKSIIYFKGFVIHNISFLYIIHKKGSYYQVKPYYYNDEATQLVELMEFEKTDELKLEEAQNFIEKRQLLLLESPGKPLPIICRLKKENILYSYYKDNKEIEYNKKYDNFWTFIETCFCSRKINLTNLKILTLGEYSHDIVVYTLLDQKRSEIFYLQIDLVTSSDGSSGISSKNNVISSGLTFVTHQTYQRILLSNNIDAKLKIYSIKDETSLAENSIQMDEEFCYFINKTLYKFSDNIYQLKTFNCKYFGEMMFEIPLMWINYREICKNFYVKWE